MDLSKTLNKRNNQMIRMNKPITMLMSFPSSTKSSSFDYARSLVLERDRKLIARSKVFIGLLNLVEIKLVHILYIVYNTILSSLNSNLHLQTWTILDQVILPVWFWDLDENCWTPHSLNLNLEKNIILNYFCKIKTIKYLRK